MKHSVYVALGSNQGQRLNNLRLAFKFLKQIFTETTSSIVLETKAIVPNNAPKNWDIPFLNMVVHGYTQQEPHELLKNLKAIEGQLGREPKHEHWSPRIIDLDILLYDQIALTTPDLIIPHPELKNRDFLIHLLASMQPNLQDPLTQITFAQLAQEKINPTSFTKSFALYPQLMGIVNITPDSFSDGGLHFSTDDAIKHCYQLISDGASLLDLGAQSTRPGSQQLDANEEWNRLHPVLDALNLKNIPISIDTYRNDLIEKLLNRYPIAWINDVSGRLETSILRQIAQAGCKICTMHSLSVPPRKNENIEKPWSTLNIWCQQQIEKLTNCGFTYHNIILDPGFGFAKTPYQTGFMLKTIEQLHRWNCPILVGHSRKSFYNLLGCCEAAQRDTETLAVSQLLKNKVEYLRVHNVNLHQRFFSTQHWIENCHGNSNN